MYPLKDGNEREQIEWVFGLTGGELADKPLRYAEVTPSVHGRRLNATRHWARYFYDGVPDYAPEIERRLGGSFMTIVSCELFGTMPRVIHAAGKRWRRAASFTSSGETECPNAGDEEHEDPTRECPLCERPPGEKHGMIYIGDGWAEVVYRARD